MYVIPEIADLKYENEVLFVKRKEVFLLPAWNWNEPLFLKV